MKFSILLFFSAMLLVESCNSARSNEEALYGHSWELEYISGPRIAFDALFPEKRPLLTFDKGSGKVTGSDSCNGYMTDFELTENSIVFGEPSPTTMMFCGGSERHFLEMMKKIDGYSFERGKLNLLVGEIPMMRFKKIKL